MLQSCVWRDPQFDTDIGSYDTTDIDSDMVADGAASACTNFTTHHTTHFAADGNTDNDPTTRRLHRRSQEWR